MPSRIYGKKEKKYPVNERGKRKTKEACKGGRRKKIKVSLSLSLLIFTVTNLSFRSVKERARMAAVRQSCRVKLITVPIAATEIYGVHARGIQFRQKSRISNGIRLGFIGDILSNIIYRYVNETLGREFNLGHFVWGRKGP